MQNNHLHETEESVYVEVINPDENGFGNYIITSLINRAMPLIRYDIGDIGNIVENTCDCGKKGVYSIYSRVERVSFTKILIKKSQRIFSLGC